MVQVRITSVRVSDGTEISIPHEGVVLLVGPNNAGKSQALKDLLGLGGDRGAYSARVFVEALFEKIAPPDLTQWIATNLPHMTRDGITKIRVEGWGDVQPQDIVNQWVLDGLGVLRNLFMLHIDGTSRLTAGNSQPSINFSIELPSHPIQRAYQDSELERELSNKSEAAFGLELTVDRYSGSVISLRLGPRPHFDHVEGRPTDTYLTQLQELPRLEDQGDGIRSYVGLLLHMSAGTHQIILVDEPEAFLHPPQAQLLGRVLAERAQTRQAFIATHSSNIVQGALEAGTPTTIVRITRQGNVNHAAVLQHEAVKELWSDPLLRYSNVLDGLFNDAVILCESDADCRYYSAVLDNLISIEPTEPGSRSPQVLFTHSGGKSRMASVVNALSAVSVPVIVVADFDVLKNEADVKKLVTSLGGRFEAFERDLRIVASALESGTKPLRKITLKDELVRRIEALPGDAIAQRDAEALRAMIHAETGWDRAKRSGKNAVPQGEASDACERLLLALTDIGMLVVPVGELERFAPGVAGHGPSWVTEVLEQGLHKAPGRDAVDFVEGLRAAASRQVGRRVTPTEAAL
jgi:energy-coupling factor transporter ATP-binding protein EcfA2